MVRQNYSIPVKQNLCRPQPIKCLRVIRSKMKNSRFVATASHGRVSGWKLGVTIDENLTLNKHVSLLLKTYNYSEMIFELKKYLINSGTFLSKLN